MVLPYTQVKYIFGTSAVSPALATYYGCVLGKAVKLHDLATHGWFTPTGDECGGNGATAAFDGRTFHNSPLYVSPDGTDGAYPYPNLGNGNTVDISTIKTYYRNLKTVSMFADGTSRLYAAVPLSSSKFRVLRFGYTNSAKTLSGDDVPFIVTEGKIKPKIDNMTLDDPNSAEMMLPGRFVMKIHYQVTDIEEPATGYLIDVRAMDNQPMEHGVKGVDGKLYYYEEMNVAEEGETPEYQLVYKPKELSSTISYHFDDTEGTFVFSGTVKFADNTHKVIADIGNLKYNLGSYAPAANSSDPFLGTRTSAENGQDMFYVGPRYHYTSSSEAEEAILSSETAMLGDLDYVISVETGSASGDNTAWPRYKYTDDGITIDVGEGERSGIDSEEVREAFLVAETQKTLLPFNSGVITSLGKLDRENWTFYSNYSVFNSLKDYAPCYGIAVCRYSDDHPVRVNIDVDPLTAFMTVNEGEMRFDHWDYTWDGSECKYLGSYDTDPDDPYNRPAIDQAYLPDGSNFIKGDFRIEYWEKVTSNTMTGENGLYRTDLLGDNENIEDYIGQPDPRNPLGYAYALVKELTTADFYALAITDLEQGLGTLEKYRNIFHVWYVNDDGQPTDKFYNWIDLENQPEASRFRIGYQYQMINDTVARTLAPLRGSFATDPDDAYPYSFTCIGAQFADKLGVIPGDTIEDVKSKATYKVKTVNNDVLMMDDLYIPTYPFEMIEASEDDEEAEAGEWAYTYIPGDHFGREVNGTTCRAKIRYMVKGLDGIKRPHVAEGLWTDLAEDPTHNIYLTFEPAVSSTNTLSWKVYPSLSAEGEVTILSGALDIRNKLYTDYFNVYRVYNTQEKADALVQRQSSNNMACVTVLTRDIVYTSSLYRSIDPTDTAALDAFNTSSAYMEKYTFMPDWATPGLIFGTKLATQPHMPLTLVSFSIPGMGEVKGMREFSHQNLEELLAAGYCMLNSEVGGLPFCETDCTVGYPKYGDSDRGLLSKITPVLMYGKDVYNVTNDWKGPMNTGTPELVSGLGTALSVLKKRYTDTHYNLLGTLLKSVSDATITFDGSHVVIEHHISSQDPARYVDNTVYVE